MSRKIYNRLSFLTVSWLDESTLLDSRPARQSPNLVNASFLSTSATISLYKLRTKSLD